MKKLISLLICLLLALTLCATALADVVKATGGDSNLRTGPGLKYSEAGVLKKGASATYLGETSTDNRGVDWYKISYNGKTCWVSSKYTKVTKDGGSSSYGTVKATGGDSNLRTGPGLSYSEAGVLKKGASATYLGEISTDNRGVDWYKISYNGKTCWVSSKYTKRITGSDSGSESSGTVKATGGDSNLRTGPGLKYSEAGVLKKGATATYLGETSTDNRGVDWYKIRYNGKNCWVSSKYTALY